MCRLPTVGVSADYIPVVVVIQYVNFAHISYVQSGFLYPPTREPLFKAASTHVTGTP